MAAGRVKFKATLDGPPSHLTFGCFLEGPVQMQVCGSRKDRVRDGTASEVGVPVRLPQLLLASLLPRAGAKGLSQGLKNVPREGRN